MSRYKKNTKPKLLEHISEQIRLRHYSFITEKTYVLWINKYIYYHQKITNRIIVKREGGIPFIDTKDIICIETSDYILIF